MPSASRTSLGFNVYYGSLEWQNRFLVECLRPALSELDPHGEDVQLWFERYDARGPHVLLLLLVSPEREAEIQERLEGAISEYLRRRPAPDDLSPEELAERHAVCARRPLCAVDAEPGMEPPSSYRAFRQPRAGYPYVLTRDHPRSMEIWQALDRQARWTLECLDAVAPRAATGAAAAWLASMDLALSRRLDRPEAFWRHYGTSLVPPLAERLEHSETEALESVAGTVRGKNREAFDRIWTRVVREGPVRPELPDLLETVVAPELSPDGLHRLLREVAYGTFKQLGVMAAFQVPLVFYAWHRCLEEHRAA